MPPKKASNAPTNPKKKGGRSQSNPSDPLSTEVDDAEDDVYLGSESGYNMAVTTISISHTSRNSSAPIVIPLEPDGSNADPGKLLSTARKAKKA